MSSRAKFKQSQKEPMQIDSRAKLRIQNRKKNLSELRIEPTLLRYKPEVHQDLLSNYATIIFLPTTAILFAVTRSVKFANRRWIVNCFNANAVLRLSVLRHCTGIVTSTSFLFDKRL